MFTNLKAQGTLALFSHPAPVFRRNVCRRDGLPLFHLPLSLKCRRFIGSYLSCKRLPEYITTLENIFQKTDRIYRYRIGVRLNEALYFAELAYWGAAQPTRSWNGGRRAQSNAALAVLIVRPQRTVLLIFIVLALRISVCEDSCSPWNFIGDPSRSTFLAQAFESHPDEDIIIYIILIHQLAELL